MERLTNINQTTLDSLRADVRVAYDQYNPPCPPSRLKTDDDVNWLGFVNGRVIWGHDDPGYFFIYAPDIFGDASVPVPVEYVYDRAPADENEEPLPIFPEEPPQQFAQQPGVKDHLAGKKGKGKTKHNPSADEIKQVLTKLLASLPPDVAKKARQYIKQHRSDIQLPEG